MEILHAKLTHKLHKLEFDIVDGRTINKVSGRKHKTYVKQTKQSYKKTKV